MGTEYQNFHKHFFVDFHTGQLFWKHISKYHKEKVGRKAGWFNSYGYRYVKLGGQQYPVHHVVWCMWFGNLPEQDIDHINGLKFDNRLTNLREVSRKTNVENTPARSSNKLGVKHIRKLCGGFQVRVGGKSYGVFDNIEEAIKIRDSVITPCLWKE